MVIAYDSLAKKEVFRSLHSQLTLRFVCCNKPLAKAKHGPLSFGQVGEVEQLAGHVLLRLSLLILLGVMHSNPPSLVAVGQQLNHRLTIHRILFGICVSKLSISLKYLFNCFSVRLNSDNRMEFDIIQWRLFDGCFTEAVEHEN